MVDCGCGLNRSSTLAGLGSFFAAPWVELWKEICDPQYRCLMIVPEPAQLS